MITLTMTKKLIALFSLVLASLALAPSTLAQSPTATASATTSPTAMPLPVTGSTEVTIALIGFAVLLFVGGFFVSRKASL